VSAAGLVSELPFSNTSNSSPFRIIGRDPDPNGPEMHANMRVVSDDYFATMRIPLLRGRTFDATDVNAGQFSAIIDAQLAKQFFPNEDPIGKRINQGPDATIVGVVGTVSHGELGEPAKATVYYSFRQAAWYSSFFVTLRTTLAAPALASTMRVAAASVDRNAPVFDFHTLDDRIGASLAPRRLAMTVLTALATLSLLLAIFGLYGVISYAVSQRTTEFGIRSALGAQPRQLRALVVRQGLQLALAGIAIGVVISWLAMRSLSALLFGVSSHDPLTFAGMIVLVTMIAAAASFVPARRATAIPLTTALRGD
jgi:predicted permease